MIAPSYMNNGRLQALIEKSATVVVENQPGFWKFQFADSLVFVITDQSHNRMRMMTPVAEVETIPPDRWRVLMAANFDRALDARYCINDETLWSAFIHPLEQLNDGQFLSGLDQVVTLAKNYGTTFSSGGLIFGG